MIKIRVKAKRGPYNGSGEAEIHMSSLSVSRSDLFRRHIALPQQHGSWALWLGPYAVGLGVSPALKPALIWLTLASLGGFLLLQPLTVLVKVLAGRRPRTDLAPAAFWIGAHGLLAGIGMAGLMASGSGLVLWLGLASLPVLAWQLWLVARREERGQMGVELVGAGVLALAAPAAYWVDAGRIVASGWWLWLLCWLQSSGAIVYIYLRLEHRRMSVLLGWPERVKMAWRSTLYNAANLFATSVMAAAGWVPWLILLPFAAMLAEALYGGLLRPGIAAKPVTIGIRQVLVTAVVSALTILAFRI